MGVGILLLCCCGLVCAGVGFGTGAAKESAAGGVLGVIGILMFLAAYGWSIGFWGQMAAETEPYNDKNGVPIGRW
jgi:hypothetical protein